MKVLLISNYKRGTGGISGQVELLQKNLINEGIATSIFNTKGSILHRVLCCTKLNKLAKDYDILHIHCCSGVGFFPAVVGIIVGKHLHKKIILTYHGGGADKFFNRYRLFVRYFLLKTDTNIVLSGFLGSVFDKYQIPYTIIPNTLEFDESRYKIRDSIKPNFISIRTLSPLYNIECILRAYKQVKEQISAATLTIVGDGPSRQDLEAFVTENNIEGVEFVGRVDNSKIYSYLDKADIMLSAPKIDNMPVSLLEAFNAGLLVISSNVGGVPYMITEGTNGLLFTSNNHIELAEKIIFALNHNNLAKYMIISAHNSLDQYKWAEVWAKLKATYSLS